MIKKFFSLTIFILLLFGITVISYATTNWYSYHVNTYWCVDSGKHLDWSGSTTFQSHWNTGVNTWNNYKSGVIRADTIFTVNDVTITDVSYLSGGAIASTNTSYPSGGGKGTAVISFSTVLMNTLTSIKRDVVCTHELGHTLGLSENNDSGTNVVMYNDMDTNTSNNVLHNEDKLNYDYMYNYKY